MRHVKKEMDEGSKGRQPMKQRKQTRQTEIGNEESEEKKGRKNGGRSPGGQGVYGTNQLQCPWFESDQRHFIFCHLSTVNSLVKAENTSKILKLKLKKKRKKKTMEERRKGGRKEGRRETGDRRR